MMQQPLGQLDAPLHPAGEGFDEFPCAIRQADARKDFVDPLVQGGAAQAIKMALMPKILVSRKLQVDALRLKNHADLPPQARRIERRIAAHDNRASGGWKHQGGKNPEKSSLA